MADLQPAERWALLSQQWAAHRERGRVKWDAAMHFALALNASLVAVLGCTPAHLSFHKVIDGQPIPPGSKSKVGHPLEAIEIGDDGNAKFGFGFLLEASPNVHPKQIVVINVEIDYTNKDIITINTVITEPTVVRLDNSLYRGDIDAFSERIYSGLMRALEDQSHKPRMGFSVPSQRPDEGA
jgi:hypothetical protein